MRNSQLWKPSFIKFLEPCIDCSAGNLNNFIAYIECLKKYSTKLTAGANLTIPPTAYGALSMLSREVLSRHGTMVDKGTQLWVPLHLENFLLLSQSNKMVMTFVSNARFIYAGLVNILNNPDNKALRSLLLNQQRSKVSADDYWESVRGGVAADFDKYEYPGPSRSVNASANKAYCNIRFAWVVVFYHACICDINKVNLLPRLFKPPNPSYRQREKPEYYQVSHKYLTSHDWLKHHIFEVHQVLVKTISAKVDFESFIIERLRKESDSDPKDPVQVANRRWKNMMVAGNFHYDFSGWSAVGGIAAECMSSYKQSEKMSGQVGSRKGSTLRNRLKSLLHAALLFDIIEAYLEYGPDPVLPDPPTSWKDNLGTFRKYQE